MSSPFEKPSCSKDVDSTGKASHNTFKQSESCLKPLDDLLRCHICFDYFNVCMTTKCNHNYCSLCIRRALAYKAECPKCFQEVGEPDLSNNRLIDDILFAYQKVRNDLDNAVEKNMRCSNPSCSASSNWTCDTEVTDAKSNASNSDEEFTSNDTHVITTAKICNIINDIKVSCPVCITMVFPNKINSHLDSCLAINNIPEKDEVIREQKRTELPKIAFHLLSDNDIKKRLKSYGLKTTGNRQDLISRYKNFSILYNSDCDSLNPRPVADIVKQVEKEEMDLKNNATSKLFHCDKKSNPEMIQYEHEQYVERHAEQFSSLITEIQRRELENMKKLAVQQFHPLESEDSADTSHSEIQSLHSTGCFEVNESEEMEEDCAKKQKMVEGNKMSKEE